MINHEPIIVVVDPDEDRATALSSQLDRRGFHVIRRSSGIDALECVVEYRPDLVLSESELLDLGGSELLYSIHEASPTTRVLFVERKGSNPWLSKEMEHPFQEQDVRPESAADIALKIDQLLER